MAHFASQGFHHPGGIGDEEFDALKREDDKDPPEGVVYRVISMPSFLPLPYVTFTQYSTCFAHNIDAYVAHGWKDEGFEAMTEKMCIDWINTKPDCSLERVFKNNPDLVEKLKRAKPVNLAARRQQHHENQLRRGKYVSS